jgi:parallel beta-helix repeat protein
MIKRPVISRISEDKNQLLPIDEIIEGAREVGVDFGKTDPYNRIRYYIKLGLLPHPNRKIDYKLPFDPNKPPHTVGHFPAFTINKLKEIENFRSQGLSANDIKNKFVSVSQDKENLLEANLTSLEPTTQTKLTPQNPPTNLEPEDSPVLDKFLNKVSPAFLYTVAVLLLLALVTISHYVFNPDDAKGFFNENNSKILGITDIKGDTLWKKTESVLKIILYPPGRVSLGLLRILKPDETSLLDPLGITEINDTLQTDTYGDLVVIKPLQLRGSPQLKVDSDELVENLNADLLDGRHAGTSAGDILVLDNKGDLNIKGSATVNSIEALDYVKAKRFIGIETTVTNILESTTINNGTTIDSLAWTQITSQPTILSSLDGVSNDEGNINLIAGSGIGIAPNNSANTITLSNTNLGSSQFIFKNIAVSGESTIVTDSNNDTLTLVEGANITLTTNAVSDTLTITAAGGTSLWTDQTAYIEPSTIGANDLRIYDSGGLAVGGTTDPGTGNLDVSGNIRLGTTDPDDDDFLYFDDGSAEYLQWDNAPVGGFYFSSDNLNIGGLSYFDGGQSLSLNYEGGILSDVDQMIQFYDDGSYEALSWDGAYSGDIGVTGENQFELSDDLGVSGNLFVTGTIDLSSLGSAGPTALCRNGSNQISTCSAGAGSDTLQSAYDNDPDGGNAIIALTADDESLIFRNPAASGTDSGNPILTLDQLATGAGAVDALGISQVGDVEAINIDVTLSEARTTDVFTITQANHGSNNSTQSLLQLTNNDTASTAALLNISQGSTSGGVGLAIANIGWGGTAIEIGTLIGGNGIDIPVARVGSSNYGIRLGGTFSGTGGPFLGDAILINPTNTLGAGSLAMTGNLIDASRSFSGSGGTITDLGDLVTLSSTCSGTCSDTSNILQLDQQFASATGAVLNILNSGAGADISLANGETIDNSVNGSIRFSGSSTDNLIILPVADGGTALTGTITSADITGSNKTWTFPDATGTVVLGTTDKRVATKIVAASDSANPSQADYQGDGTGDDEEIEDAIAALPAGGGVVYLLEGTYYIGDGVGGPPIDCSIEDGIDIIKSNVTIIGAGKSTILQRACDTGTNDGVIIVGDGGTAVSGVTIADLSIDGVKATYIGEENIGIYFNNAVTYSTIRNTYVHDNYGMGIYLYGETTANTHNLIQGNDVRNNDRWGIQIRSSLNNTITGNNIEGNFSSGIYLYTSPNNTITGNNIEGTSSTGIYIYFSSDNNTITGNNIEGNGSHGISFSTSSNNTVTGNKIHDNGGSGSSDSISVSNSDENLISSNDITDTAGTGYAISVEGAGSDNNYLIGNHYSGTGASSINDTGTGTTIQHRDQFEIESARTLGTLLSLGIPSSTTLTGALTGTNINFLDNLTVNGQDVIGLNINNITAGAGTETAINIGTGWDTGVLVSNEVPVSFGTGGDINMLYNETDDLFSAGTALTASQNTDYGIFTFAVDTGNSGMTANQEVFEIGKGGPDDSDGNYVELLSLDEDGDLDVYGHGAFGSGASNTLYDVLYVNETMTSIPAFQDGNRGIVSHFTVDGLGLNNEPVVAIEGTSFTASSDDGDFLQLTGVEGQVTHQATALSNITNARAIQGRVSLTSAGDITNAYSFYAYNPIDSGAGTITNAYGLYIEDITTGGTKNVELAFAGTTPVIEVGNTGTLTFNDGTNTLMTLVDTGSVGRLAITGDLDVAGHSAFGTPANVATNVIIYVSEEDTSTSGNRFGISTNLIADPGSASTATFYGIRGRAQTKSGNAQDVSGLIGVAGAADHVGTGTATNSYAFYAENPINNGTLNNAYGLYVEDITGGSSNYGIYIAGGNTYSLYSASDDINFIQAAADSLNIDAGTTDKTEDAVTFDVDVNSASVDAIFIDLDVGTALSAAEVISGVNIDVAGLAGDDSTSALNGILLTGDTTSAGTVTAIDIEPTWDIDINLQNDETIDNSTNGTILLQDGGSTTLISTSTTDLKFNLDDTTTYTEVLCHSGADAATGVVDVGDCEVSGGGADVAEYFGTDGSLEAGDIVTTDSSRPAQQIDDPDLGLTSKAWVVASANSYDPQIIGIVSTNPNLTLAEGVFSSEEHPVPIALSGRVPIKVSMENGVIYPGDPLTSSSTPGVAMKATKSGPIVGKALGAYSGSGTGKIMVFINVGWYVAPLPENDGEPANSNANLIDTKTLSADRVNTQILFIGDRQLSMATDGSLSIDGDVNILGDISVGGDLKIEGQLEASEITTDKLNINKREPNPGETPSSSLGRDTIKSEQTYITVETTAVNRESEIFVTATTLTGGQALVVTQKTPRESFTVTLETPVDHDVTFSWFIVN